MMLLELLLRSLWRVLSSSLNESDVPSLENVQVAPSQNMSSSPILQHFISVSGLFQISSNTTSIVIPSNSFNTVNVTQFSVKGLPYLESIVIGDNCFQHVTTVEFVGLTSLQSITIGSNSFTNHKFGYHYDPSRNFAITNCSSLQSLMIDRFSFSDFAVFNLSSGQ